MGNYVLGSPIHMRGLYWNARLYATPSIAGDLFTTPQAHGLSNGQTVAMLNGAIGGLDDRDAYGQFQVYAVLNVTSLTFQLGYPTGGALVVTSEHRGILSVLADPTTASLVITPFDGQSLPAVTPTKEEVGVFFYDYVTTQRGPNGIYQFFGTPPVLSASKGTFSVS